MNYLGNLIYRERMRRNWSQDGLCKGICGVSYLSKIENGRAEPSDEILRLLLQRLELESTPEADRRASQLAEDAYEALFTDRIDELQMLMADRPWDNYRATPAGLDLLLLRAWVNGETWAPLDAQLETCMDTRQLALQRILQKRCNEAIALLPNAFCHFNAGMAAYGSGDISNALHLLQRAYDLAAQDGAPHLMLQCKTFIGNCYSARRDVQPMLAHYAVARRLAKALRHDEILASIDYNVAATQLDTGNTEAAYAYFSRLSSPKPLALHKLAICCEKLGKRAEALAALDLADAMPAQDIAPDTMRMMCGVARFRLEHEDYLSDDAYGELLLNLFAACRRDLPIGFATFHLPWVIEYYTATRQYKRAFELLNDFPAASL